MVRDTMYEIRAMQVVVAEMRVGTFEAARENMTTVGLEKKRPRPRAERTA